MIRVVFKRMNGKNGKSDSESIHKYKNVIV